VREFVARENIRRFEAQLVACTDPEQRKTLSRLLEIERQHLAQALDDKQSRPEAS
jgi:chromosome segregation and condensation protein ScpB